MEQDPIKRVMRLAKARLFSHRSKAEQWLCPAVRGAYPTGTKFSIMKMWVCPNMVDICKYIYNPRVKFSSKCYDLGPGK